MRWTGAIAAALLLAACTSSSPVAGGQSPSRPSPSAVDASPMPSAVASPTPSSEPSTSEGVAPASFQLPIGKPVSRQVLAPATVLPIARLCQYKLTDTADGNYWPTLCAGGAINVLAWRAYIKIGVHVMSLNRSATLLQVETAMCRDGKFLHATRPESEYAFGLAAAYYGWTYAAAISKWENSQYDPNHPLC